MRTKRKLTEAQIAACHEACGALNARVSDLRGEAVEMTKRNDDCGRERLAQIKEELGDAVVSLGVVYDLIYSFDEVE